MNKKYMGGIAGTLATSLTSGPGAFFAIKDLFSHPDPVHPYRGGYGLIGPNQLGYGPSMQYRYDGMRDARSSNAPWYENQNEYMRQYDRFLQDNGGAKIKSMLSQPGFISHMGQGAGQSGSVLGPASGISAALAPYFNGQPYAPPVGIGTIPTGR